MTDVVFKTDEGDYDVTLFSPDGQRRFKLAQQLVVEVQNLYNELESKQAALQWFKSKLSEECNAGTKIKED